MAVSIELLLPLQNDGASQRLSAMAGPPSTVMSVRYALAEAVTGAKVIKRKSQLNENIECKIND
tara:strand:+ start:204 stop:395 length:192 start_codon:yes stop_codon:yes gene_type:complete